VPIGQRVRLCRLDFAPLISSSLEIHCPSGLHRWRRNGSLLNTSMKGGSAQMQDVGLEGVEALGQGRQIVTPENHDNGLYSFDQDR